MKRHTQPTKTTPPQKSLAEQVAEFQTLAKRANVLDGLAHHCYTTNDMKKARVFYLQQLEVLNLLNTLLPTVASEISADFSNNFLNTHYMLAKAYFDSEDYPNTKIHLAAVQQRSAVYQYHSIQCLLGYSAYRQANYGTAEVHLRMACQAVLGQEFVGFDYYLLAVGLQAGHFKRTPEEQQPETLITYWSRSLAHRPQETRLALGTYYAKDLGDVEKGIETLKSDADSGSVEACARIAPWYLSLNNIESYIFYSEKAARLGDATTAFNLGYFFDIGKETPRDPLRALYWYNVAKDLNFPAAFHNLACKYLAGEDVEKDEVQAVALYTEATALDYAPSINDLGRCHRYGLGNLAPDRAQAMELYRRAYEKGLIQSGHNLAFHTFEESASEPELVRKKALTEEAITVWTAVSDQNHLLASLNLAFIYQGGLGGVPPNFDRAEFYYLRARALGAAQAHSGLAILYLNEFSETRDQALSQALLEKFKQAIYFGRSQGDELSEGIHQSLVACKDYTAVFEQYKVLQHQHCIQENNNILGIAADATLSPERRIQQIFSSSLSKDLDTINLSTLMYIIGKLFKESDFSPAFLSAHFEKLMRILARIQRQAEHFNTFSLINIMQGLTALALDPTQTALVNLITILTHQIKLKISEPDFTLEQLLTLLNAIAGLGVKHPDLTELSQILAKKAMGFSFDSDKIGRFLYSLAVLENHHRTPQNNSGLFPLEILQKAMSQIPKPATVTSPIVLNQLYMGLFYWGNVLKIEPDGVTSATVSDYFKPDVVRTLQQASQHSFTSKPRMTQLQRQVTVAVKKELPKARSEYFIRNLPVDIFIENCCFIQVNGPRHFLFDPTRKTKTPAPKDLLRKRLLSQMVPEPGVDVPFDDWEDAVSRRATTTYLRQLLKDFLKQTTTLPPVGEGSVTFDYSEKSNQTRKSGNTVSQISGQSSSRSNISNFQ